MSRLLPIALALATLGAHASAHAQPAVSSTTPSRIRIVVFQFSSVPDDSGHRAFAATVARSLVNSLVADSAFHVMAHPRASRDSSGAAGDAQYAVVGAVADQEGKLTVELRVLDIQHVGLLAKESLPLTDASTAGALMTATTELAARIRDRINAAPLP